MLPDTAGDPMSGLKWTRKTTTKIAKALCNYGVRVSSGTVGRLLKLMGFRLRVNHKKRSTASPKNRDRQFHVIKRRRTAFARSGDPVISVDCKKRELIGNFKNNGTAWKEQAVETLATDYRSDAEGIAVPYGIYDTRANRGLVVVGTSRETPTFAADCVAKWWQLEGKRRYPDSHRLMILADGGGGNRSTSHAWRVGLQQKLCDTYGLTVTVCHYPPGASKWNPVEHRLFGPISSNWQGEPLASYDKALKFIRTTKTETGLQVRAIMNTRDYPKGVKVPAEELETLFVRKNRVLPEWNYTISPRSMSK